MGGGAGAEPEVEVDYCGEVHPLAPGDTLVLGREGDVAIDDNPYLHRRFLVVEQHDGMWWLANVGAQLSATVADADGTLQSWLAPGARVPLVFRVTSVRFTAGPTTYELDVRLAEPPFAEAPRMDVDDGETTIGAMPFTLDQRLLMIALAEPFLRGDGKGIGAVPTSQEAALRLGWTITKFNRKLDNVCQKLSKIGVRGLHGEAGALASNRRARLIEYVLAARLVSATDLALLPDDA